MRTNNPATRVLMGVLIASCINCTARRPGKDVNVVDHFPALFPYLSGMMIPANIAPLNFIVKEPGERFFISILKKDGPSINLETANPSVTIPPQKWKKLLMAARGAPIGFTVYALRNGSWSRYETIWDTVCAEDADPFITYRKIPVCKDWTYMGLYQRDIRNFDERMVFHNAKNGVCFHCHSFRNNNAEDMALEVRSRSAGTPLLLNARVNGKVCLRAINTKTAFSSGRVGFTAWHPTKDFLAFSMNRFEMLFNSAGIEPREVFDAAGDIALFDFARNKVINCPELSKKDRIETMPEWSKDGRFLYFCSAPQMPETRYREVKCDLMRIAFDPETRLCGQRDTILTAAQAGGSILEPKCSPDGKTILATLADYSDFPIDKVGSRLCLIDLNKPSIRKLEFNTPWTDGWHSWSGSGRWIVFSSKRMNGRFSSLWLSYIDTFGVAHAPFVLPQKDPEFYKSSLLAYTIPEFTASRIKITARQFATSIEAYRKNSEMDVAEADSAQSEASEF